MDNDEVGMNGAYRHYGCLWQGVVGNDKIGIMTPTKSILPFSLSFKMGEKKNQQKKPTKGQYPLKLVECKKFNLFFINCFVCYCNFRK